MFRENVLIALTVLVTLLALSFVILLTAYMQIHQMEEKLKQLEQHRSQLKTNFSVPGNIDNNVTIQETERIWNGIFNGKWKSKEDVLRQFRSPKPTTKLPPKNGAILKQATRNSRRASTEGPKNEGIYTYDDPFFRFPSPPPKSLHVPYNLYQRNGHITLQVPPSIKLSKEKVDQVKKVLEELNELFHLQKSRDHDRNAMFLDGSPQASKGRSASQGKQNGLIWLRNEPATTMRPRHEPFDDTYVFNVVANNRIREMGLDQLFGKRKKRSLRRPSPLERRHFGKSKSGRPILPGKLKISR